MDELRYRNYLLGVLLVILAANYVDRLALGLLLQSVKADLDLTDTQLGFLGGIAFALFYSLMGIPIARWADRGNRVAIIALTTAVWSAAVALCGLATTFAQLLVIRIGVAVGEAGCIPPAHSLIADHFDRAERPRAVARYMLGGSLSVVIGYFVAGWLNELYGWRSTFVILGVPGLGLAALAWFTLREPRAATSATAATSRTTEPRLGQVCAALWANVTFRHLLASFSLVSFFVYGMTQWKPAFFIRSFGLSTGELGTWFSLIYGLGGLAGTYLGGEWASRRAANDEPRQLRVVGVICATNGVISALVYLSADLYLAFALMAVAAVGGAATGGPLFATIQTLVPPRMRATSIALVFLAANLIGMGLGPLAAGALSDLLRQAAGEESLRYSLLALCPGYLWAGWHAWHAAATAKGDLEAARSADDR